MAKVEKRRDKKRKLIWAKGAARDVYRDPEIANSTCGKITIAGDSTVYAMLLPRHCAGNIIGEFPPGKNMEEVIGNLPPFDLWRFVVVAYRGKGDEVLEFSREISGEVVIELAKGWGRRKGGRISGSSPGSYNKANAPSSFLE